MRDEAYGRRLQQRSVPRMVNCFWLTNYPTAHHWQPLTTLIRPMRWTTADPCPTMVCWVT